MVKLQVETCQTLCEIRLQRRVKAPVSEEGINIFITPLREQQYQNYTAKFHRQIKVYSPKNPKNKIKKQIEKETKRGGKQQETTVLT